jgi:hypothetical protein
MLLRERGVAVHALSIVYGTSGGEMRAAAAPRRSSRSRRITRCASTAWRSARPHGWRTDADHEASSRIGTHVLVARREPCGVRQRGHHRRPTRYDAESYDDAGPAFSRRPFAGALRFGLGPSGRVVALRKHRTTPAEMAELPPAPPRVPAPHVGLRRGAGASRAVRGARFACKERPFEALTRK